MHLYAKIHNLIFLKYTLIQNICVHYVRNVFKKAHLKSLGEERPDGQITKQPEERERKKDCLVEEHIPYVIGGFYLWYVWRNWYSLVSPYSNKHMEIAGGYLLRKCTSPREIFLTPNRDSITSIYLFCQ